jgi:DNA-binding NtrC family response regulator
MINSIRMPPLRDRPGDIPLLIKKFLASESRRTGKMFEGLSDGVIDYLKGYSFPNNVQELRTMIAGAVAGADGGALSINMLPPSVRDMIEADKATGPKEFVPRRLEDVVREFVQQTLEHFEGRRDIAARELGISLEELDRLTT